MPLYINTNVTSLTAQRSLDKNNKLSTKSLEKLSTGFRINRGNDDAAGFVLSENLRAQVRGTHKALDNAQDGINVLFLADGTYNTITSNLQRVRELVVQGSNDTNGTDQRLAIKSELDQLSTEIDRIIRTTKFNGKTLLDGSQSSYYLQVGANGTSNDQINVAAIFTNNLVSNLGVDSSNLTVDSTSNAQLTLAHLDTAIGTITSRRAALGAFINRLEANTQSLQFSVESQTVAEGRIRNADIAQESTKLVSSQILQQSAVSVLSQANQTPNLALNLLQQNRF